MQDNLKVSMCEEWLWHKPPTRRSIHRSIHPSICVSATRTPDGRWRGKFLVVKTGDCLFHLGRFPLLSIRFHALPLRIDALVEGLRSTMMFSCFRCRLVGLLACWPVGLLACSSRPSSTTSQPPPSFLSSSHDLPARPPSAGAHATRLSRLFTRCPPSASPLKIGRSSFLARSAYLGASLPVADSLEVILGIRTVRIFAATRVSVRNSHASFLPVERRNRSFHRRPIYLPARTVVIDCIGGLKTL